MDKNSGAVMREGGHITINDIIALMVKNEVLRQAIDTKEKVSDIIGAQFNSLKIDEVAKAVADAKAAANMETVKKVRATFHTENLIRTVETMPVEIANIRGSIFEKQKILRTIRQSLFDAEQSIKEQEVCLMSDIAAETLPDSDKLKFSNEKVRQAELTVRKREDDGYLSSLQKYRAIKDQYEAVEDEISALEIKKKKAKSLFDADCRTLDAMTAEMNIYAAVLGARGNFVGGVDWAEGESFSFPPKSIENKDKGVW